MQGSSKFAANAEPPAQSHDRDRSSPCLRLGFSLIDLLAVVAVVAVLAAVTIPGTFRAHEISRQAVCAINLKTIGATCRIYGDANNDSWPVPPFSQRAAADRGIDYRNDRSFPGTPPNNSYDNGEVGWDRRRQSSSDTQLQPQGSTVVSVTRGFWLLVQAGDLTTTRFLCPSSSDEVDPTQEAALYFDFTAWAHVSYGYQVPFGPRDTRPRSSAHYRNVLAADKGPFYSRTQFTVTPKWVTADYEPLRADSSPGEWRPYNSPNHGGAGQGEGQNCLYPDGTVEFHRTPLAGVHGDNIYTLIEDEWDNVYPFNRYHGITPQGYNPPPHPGLDAFGPGLGNHSSTDSLIYP